MLYNRAGRERVMGKFEWEKTRVENEMVQQYERDCSGMDQGIAG